jgi:hypothetical protein
MRTNAGSFFMLKGTAINDNSLGGIDGRPSRSASAENNLQEIGVADHPAVKGLVPEPSGLVARRYGSELYVPIFVRQHPGYETAVQSARNAVVKLYSKTPEAQVGFDQKTKTFNTGKQFEYDLGKHLIAHGFITEGPESKIDEVIKLGMEVKGTGIIEEIRQALHNAEKLEAPKPRWHRGFNLTRGVVAFFWVREHLWLMTDETIKDWFNRKARRLKDGGINRQTVTKMVKELGLKKSPRPLVKELNKSGEPILLPK